jgi:plastocyanin
VIGFAPAPVRRPLWLHGLLFASACGGGPVEPAGPPTELVKGGGDEQAWYFGNPLPVAYSVVARDASGRPVPGVSVTWAVASGGGGVDPSVTVTDADGVASTTHTLGPTDAVQTVTASASGLPVVVFTASASSPPTSIAVTVADNFFAPENVVVQVDGTVTWTWGANVSFEHNVTYVSGPTPRPADSATKRTGTHSSVMTTVGLYQYVCTLHSGMDGTIRVVN